MVFNFFFFHIDLQSDEAVLVKVLEVFLSTLECDAGGLLDEKYVLQVFKCCFRIGRETRPTGKEIQTFSFDNFFFLIRIVKKICREYFNKIDSNYI